jgi:hypothetical protein
LPLTCSGAKTFEDEQSNDNECCGDQKFGERPPKTRPYSEEARYDVVVVSERLEWLKLWEGLKRLVHCERLTSFYERYFLLWGLLFRVRDAVPFDHELVGVVLHFEFATLKELGCMGLCDGKGVELSL